MKVPFSYQWKAPYDEFLPRFINAVRKAVTSEDDYRLLVVGDTGTGKSNLCLHMISLFDDKPSVVGCCGMNPESYARALGSANQRRNNGDCYVPLWYDEANVYSTETMTEYNKELTRLLGEIRGKNFFHIWAMPNPGYLPPIALDETFDGLMFIYTKDDAPKPRLYYFLDRKAIDKLRKKEGTKSQKARLTLDVLRRVAKKYALWQGAFMRYDGPLLNDYLSLKDKKMDERVNDFVNRFCGDKQFSQQDISRLERVHKNTVGNWANKAIEEGVIVEEQDFFVNGAGRRYFNEEGARKLRAFGHSRNNKGADKGGGVA